MKRLILILIPAILAAQSSKIPASKLGTSASKDVGTTSGTVASGDHGHSGVYEPVDPKIVRKDANNNVVIGTAVPVDGMEPGSLNVQGTLYRNGVEAIIGGDNTARVKTDSGIVEIRTADDSGPAELRARSIYLTGDGGPSVLAAQAEPAGTPELGTAYHWFDSVSKTYRVKDDTGAESTTVRAQPAQVGQCVTGIAADGSVSLGMCGAGGAATVLYAGSAGAAGTIGSGITMYGGPFSTTLSSPSGEFAHQILLPHGLVARKLRVYISSAQPATCTLTVTLRKNGADPAAPPTVTIPGGSPIGWYTDGGTTSVTYVAEDRLSIKFVQSECGSGSGTVRMFAFEGVPQ